MNHLAQNGATLRQERIAQLEARLQKGWDKISEAKAKRQYPMDWEDAWIALLREYERACDAPEPMAPMTQPLLLGVSQEVA